jgi:hypothetical protein
LPEKSSLWTAASSPAASTSNKIRSSGHDREFAMASEPDNYVLRTALTAEQTAGALRSSMDESQLDFIIRVNATGHRPIIGYVDGNECRLMRRPGFFSTDYAGIFDAAIFEERECTRLDGRFVKVQFASPFGPNNRNAPSLLMHKIWIVILIIFEAYNVVGSFIDADHPILNPPSVFAGIFLVFLCIAYPFVLRARRLQREFILNHLKTVLNATIVY